MTFRVETAGWVYNDQAKREKLEKLGFKFEPCGGYPFTKSLDTPTITIEISTLEDLMEFINEYGTIVLTRENITIYDDYLE